MTNTTAFDHFWREPEKRALQMAASFEDLASIALTILVRMQAEQKDVHQICGPISTGGLGNKEANLRRFQNAIIVAKRRGLLVFDQMPFEGVIGRLATEHRERSGTNAYCEEILTVFYKNVFGSGVIKTAHFLPDWQTSHGTTWERKHLAEIGIGIAEYPVEWMAEVDRMHRGADPYHCV